MSAHDSDSSTSNGEIDNESKCPQYSQRKSTLELTPQLSNRSTSPSSDDHNRRSLTDSDVYGHCASSRSFDITTTDHSFNIQGTRCGVRVDNSISGPAPKTGMLAVCRGMLPVGTEPNIQGSELLEPPTHMAPQRYNAWFPLEGGIEAEGTVKSTKLKTLSIETKEKKNRRGACKYLVGYLQEIRMLQSFKLCCHFLNCLSQHKFH